MKKRTSLILTTILLVIMTTNVSAENNTNNYDDSYYNTISAYTGVSIEDLKEIEAAHGNLEDIYGIELDYHSLSLNSAITDDPPEEVIAMTQDEYNTLLEEVSKGDILVTKDSWTNVTVLGITKTVNHGHCCLVDDKYSSDVYVTEAFGPDQLSDKYLLGDEHDHWKDYHRVRVYYPTDATDTQREEAANYADRELEGWEYDPFAEVRSTKYLNCATLVYKAYESEDIILDKSLFYATQYDFWFTVYPKDIVEDDDTTLKHNVNWSGSDW
jgi:hypothetical protein